MKFENFKVCGINLGKDFYDSFEVRSESGELEKLRNKKLKRYILKEVLNVLMSELKENEKFELVKIVKVERERWCILEKIGDNEVVGNYIVKVSFE